MTQYGIRKQYNHRLRSKNKKWNCQFFEERTVYITECHVDVWNHTHSVRMKIWLLLFILSLSNDHQSPANHLRMENEEDREHITAKAGVVLTQRFTGCRRQLLNLVLWENVTWREEAKKLTDYELGISNLYHSFWIKNIIQEINKVKDRIKNLSVQFSSGNQVASYSMHTWSTFHRWQCGVGVKLTTTHHPVPRFRMPSCCWLNYA